MKNRDKKIDEKLAKIQIGGSKAKIGKVFTFKKEGTVGLVNALLVDVSFIVPNPNQPRKHFKKESLQELADSIKERGILQPIRVRSKEDKYEIIAGERRWQAAKLAGLKEMPCIVVDQDDRETHIDALMENIHREDLNAIDRANALMELRVNLGLHSWEKVGKKLGLTRQHIYNLIGLKGLPEKVQTDIKNGILTEKHGRALKPLVTNKEKFEEAYQKIKAEKMSGDDALIFTRSLKRSQKPENQKALTIIKTANQKYQDLLLLTDFEKFEDSQRKYLKKSLTTVNEIILNTIKKLD